MRGLKRLLAYLDRHYWIPHCWNRKQGPGAVILSAPEEDREDFRQLKSADIANFCDNELAAWNAMPEAEKERYRLQESNKRLLRKFDREIEKHRKFEC